MSTLRLHPSEENSIFRPDKLLDMQAVGLWSAAEQSRIYNNRQERDCRVVKIAPRNHVTGFSTACWGNDERKFSDYVTSLKQQGGGNGSAISSLLQRGPLSPSQKILGKAA
jgi:hypothetical protein